MKPFKMTFHASNFLWFEMEIFFFWVFFFLVIIIFFPLSLSSFQVFPRKIPPSSFKLLTWVLKLSYLLLLLLYYFAFMCVLTCTYIFLNTSIHSAQFLKYCLYVHIFRAEHFVLDRQLMCFSLGRLVFPHLPHTHTFFLAACSSLSRIDSSWAFPLPC